MNSEIQPLCDLFGLPTNRRQQNRLFFARPKTTNDSTNDHDAVIEFKQITRLYLGDGLETEVKALDGIDLTIRQGEFVIIMGASGSGKTTLLNVIGLLDGPTSGEYLLNHEDFTRKISARRKARVRGRRIGFIFQDFNILDNLNVLDNVALPLQYTHRGFNYRDEQRADRILARLGLKNKEYYTPNQLSGGQRQRVAIARALINQPSIILADEPTGSLDSENSTMIMQELSNIHAAGNTILMVTHNPDLLSYGSRAIFMKDGRIAKDVSLTGSPAFKVFQKVITPTNRKSRTTKHRLHRSTAASDQSSPRLNNA